MKNDIEMICWRLSTKTSKNTPVIHACIISKNKNQKTACGKKTTGTWRIDNVGTREITCLICKEVLNGTRPVHEELSPDAVKNLKDFEYYGSLLNKKSSLSLAEHAEMWWMEQGNSLPDKGTNDWNVMYEKWVAFAFEEEK